MIDYGVFSEEVTAAVKEELRLLALIYESSPLLHIDYS